ncbi:hypothetical protein [Gluconacetobacter takamatsuzukensis]|uniref:Rhamnan synthesis protein F n=1 Tax=Gluconacetobacter takamatsuzukensis TaxID=1286190 RepID=A0A7W4PMQ2_9PROT|nr:hypothetical protein [Gluconacetobacter takamatsuzukensis]MBB2203812.1 hypothetical protein [Gluconacetobacter takamatsuzukensis]
MEEIGVAHPLIDIEWIRLASKNPSLTIPECLALQDTVGPNILFDVDFYRRTYGHEIPQGMTCLQHFCQQDASCLRDPNPLLMTRHWFEIFSWKFPHPNEWQFAFFREMGQDAIISRIEMQRDLNNDIVLSDDIIGVPPAPGQDICLFVHYDRHDEIQPYVVDYIEALKNAGVAVFLLSNTKKFKQSEIDKVKNSVWRIICADNAAYDWGLHRQGVRRLMKEYPRNPILLANDSVTYLGHGLPGIMNICRQNPNLMLGAIAAYQHAAHLQSFFIYCSSEIVTSDAWMGFWENFKYHHNKWFVVNGNEFGFSRWMIDHNVPTGGLWDYFNLLSSTKRNRSNENREKVLAKDHLVNPTMELWDVLIDQGFPFIKNLILNEKVACGNRDHLCNIISRLAKNNPRELKTLL